MPASPTPVVLLDPNELGDPEVLRQQAAPLLAPDDAESPGQYVGSTPEKALWVRVDRVRHILDVSIVPKWAQRLSAENFAGAVLSAYVLACERAFAANAVDQEESGSGGGDVGASPPPDSPEERFALAQERISRYAAELDKPAPVVPEREVQSPNGYLTVRTLGGSVSGIEGNAKAIALARVDVLREDVLAVFHAAEQATG